MPKVFPAQVPGKRTHSEIVPPIFSGFRCDGKCQRQYEDSGGFPKRMKLSFYFAAEFSVGICVV